MVVAHPTLETRRARIAEALEVLAEAYGVEVPAPSSPTFRADALVAVAEAVAALVVEITTIRAGKRRRG